MKQLFLAIFALVLISSCKKNTSDDGLLIKDGTYTGTFQRQVSGSGVVSNVTITFNSGSWTGQSQYAKYPALCSGTYNISNTNQVGFENSCVWTAEFDWTFILSGDYKLTVSGNTIEIVKDYSGTVRDIYKLTRL